MLSNGTKVRVHIVKNRVANDWSPDAEKARKDDVGGHVIGHHDSHGICYDVRHDDGSIGYYEPHELIHWPEEIGTLHISNNAQKEFDNAKYNWEEFWPRHTKALQKDKSTLSMIQLPANNQILVVATSKDHSETTICTEYEFTLRPESIKHNEKQAELVGVQMFQFERIYMYRKGEDEWGGATMMGKQMVAAFTTEEKAQKGKTVLGLTDDFKLVFTENADEAIQTLLDMGFTIALDPDYDDQGNAMWSQLG